MVTGIGKFREAFAQYADNYVIIGGTACDIVLQGTNMRPRATSDIDMIIIVERMTPEFAAAFWAFVREGGYHPAKRSRENSDESIYTLYRFDNPKDGYPIQIELLSRHPDILGEPSGFVIEPIPVGEEISSLSAIIMDDDYYHFTIRNSFVEGGLRVAHPIALMALKARAYLNLVAEKEKGRHVNTKHIKKHRSDVLKLIAATSVPEPVKATKTIYECVREFSGRMREMLPSQSLETALNRTSDDIEVFLDMLDTAFTIEE